MIEIRIGLETDFPELRETAALDLLKLVFTTEGISIADCTLVFVDDDQLGDLKKQFFGVDQYTDVIAFRMNEYDEAPVEGEIYISVPRARANAVEFGEPFGRELARLIVHGALHLLGHEDDTDDRRQAMREQEEQYLGQFDWRKLLLTG
ncbi:MAG: rRNA maturation RNase YbeY [Candidatus Neomarinimicrobiota bacterium]